MGGHISSGNRRPLRAHRCTMKSAVAPLRSYDDFIGESSRYILPKNLEKWLKRVHKNLLYYQSNYFLSLICLFLFIMFINPVTTAGGIVGVALVAGVTALGRQFLPPHLQRYALLGATFLARSYFIDIFALGIQLLLAVTAVLAHASLRKRNLANKINRALVKNFYSSLSPMGLLLRALRIQID